jgi:phospholipid/cholesterol/gamma-HCH transport system substrate-binding protein
MPKQERNAFRAGLFIVVSIALIIAVIVGIKGIGRIIEPYQIRTVTFALADDVTGLRVGDDVRVGGLKVGIVRSINIESQSEKGEPRIVLTFHIPRRLVLREGTRIGVQSTITGAANLNIDTLGTGKPLSDDAVLIGEPGAYARIISSFSALAPEMQALVHDVRTVTLPKVNTTADNAAAFTGDLKTQLKPMVERYNTATDRAAEMLTNLRDVLGDTKLDIRTTVANLKASTGTIKEKLPGIMEKLDTALAKANSGLDNAQQAIKDLSTTMDHAKNISGDVRSIIARNRTRIDELVASVKEAGDNLKFATAEIRRSPWRLLYKPRPGEVANSTLFDAARDFAEGANDMSDAATALRDALKDPKADPKEIQKLMNQLDDSFGKFTKVEDELWKRVKE